MIFNQRFFIYSLTVLLLSACTGMPTSVPTGEIPVDATESLDQEPGIPQETAEEFVELAAQTSGQTCSCLDR